jgi:PAS domain S-box-containing protein
MAETTIDYQAVFRTLPGALALVTPDGVILDVNDGYLEAAGRKLEHILGRNLFELFPENPADPGDVGPAQLRESFELVTATGEPDAMMPIRYDVEDMGRPGAFEERYWSVINTPLRSPEGQVMMIALKADEVTHIVNQSRNQLANQG